MLSISFNIDEPAIRKAVSVKVTNLLKKHAHRIGLQVGELFVGFVRNTQEWTSLSESGPHSLKAHLGLTPEIVSTGLEEILRVWKSSIFTNVVDNSAGPDLDITFYIGAVRADYSDVLSLPLSSYISVNKNTFTKRYGVKTEINWLQWLLLEADTITISNWKVKPHSKSRSGDLIMIPSRSQSWMMPAQFQKPPNNNFIDRIVDNPAFIARVLDIIINNTRIGP